MSTDELLNNETRVHDAAQLLGSMAHPQRLRILCLLGEGERSVLSFSAATGLSQPTISHHLKKLRDADLVETRRDAQTIYYSLKGKEVTSVLGVLYDLYCKV